jgi:nickel-dependent lactate racemase
MKISLTYGSGRVPIEIPDRHLDAYIHPESKLLGSEPIISPELLTEKVQYALMHPLAGGKPLAERVRGKRVAVFIEDDSRDQPHKLFLENLAPHLMSASHVHFLLTTGTHNPESPGNKAILQHMRDLGARLQTPFDVTANYSGLDPGRNVFVDLGNTSRGTPVRILKEALDAEVHLIVASLKFHYFAGYSGKHKHAIPAISDKEGTEKNHKMALMPDSRPGNHPLHPNPARQKNPLAEDMEEARKMVESFRYQEIGQRENFVLASVTYQERFIWMAAGDGDTVMRAGIQELDKYFLFEHEPVPYVIVSSGGSPQDDTFYQAHCGIELCNDVLAREVLWLAECRDGVAPTPECERKFFQRLGQYGSRFAEGRRDILDHYTLHAHKVYKYFDTLEYLVQKQKGHVYLYSTLPPETARYAHLVPLNSPEEIQQVIQRWIASDPQARILVIDGANKIHVRKR